MKKLIALSFVGSIVFTMIISIMLLDKIRELRAEVKHLTTVAWERDNELYQYVTFGKKPNPWYSTRKCPNK